MERYLPFGFLLLVTAQVHSGYQKNQNADHFLKQNNDPIAILNSPDGRELLQIMKAFMKHRAPTPQEQEHNIGKKAQDPSTTAATEEIRDLHELVRAVIERNLAPVVQQLLNGLNVPTLFGGATEAPVEVTSPSPAITTTKQYIYLYLQRENQVPQSEPVPIIPGSVLFKNSEVVANSTPITIPSSATTTTKRGKYMVIKNKNKINVTVTEDATGNELIDDEDETDILKKVQSLP